MSSNKLHGDVFPLMATPSTEQLKVLVVDDDELNRRMMRLLLSREDHHVETASNGFEAVEIACSREFDIILMDLQMPGMDGVETSRRIRESEDGGKHAYIVALTASYLPEKGQELFQAGIDNYIAKPFDIEHLRQMMKHGLDHRLKSKNYNGAAVNVNSIREIKVLDVNMGIKQVGGDDGSYRELLADFVGQLPGKIETMKMHFTDKNMDALSRFAHNIKGVSASLGALQLSEYAGRLEKLAGEGYTDLVSDIFKEFVGISQILLDEASNFSAMRSG